MKGDNATPQTNTPENEPLKVRTRITPKLNSTLMDLDVRNIQISAQTELWFVPARNPPIWRGLGPTICPEWSILAKFGVLRIIIRLSLELFF